MTNVNPTPERSPDGTRSPGPLLGMRLVNLRTFPDTGPINLREFNFIFGKNSSGKTTLLRAPLLFRQIFEANSDEIDTSLAGPLVDFGSYAEAVHGSHKSNDIELSFRLDVSRNLSAYRGARRRSGDSSIGIVTITLVLHWNKTRGHLQISRIAVWDKQGLPVADLSRRGPSAVYVEMPELGIGRTFYETGELTSGVIRDVVLLVLNETNDIKLADRYFSIVYLIEAVERAFSLVHHVGPLRNMPERAYRADQLAFGATSTQSVISMLQGKSNALQAVAESLRRMGIARDITITSPAPGYSGISVLSMEDRRSDNLADVGFGVSQVLPILAQIVTAPSESLVLIEQPELHLHPETQGSLVDEMIRLAQERRITLLVETHSENMLLRLRRRVATGEVDSSDVKLLIATNHEVRQTAIEPDGKVDMGVFPQDFFEEDWLDTLEIAKAARAR